MILINFILFPFCPTRFGPSLFYSLLKRRLRLPFCLSFCACCSAGSREHTLGLHRDHEAAARALLIAREEAAAAALANPNNRPVSRYEVLGVHQWQYTSLRGAHFTPKPKTAASEAMDRQSLLDAPSATFSSASVTETVSSSLGHYEHPVSYLPHQRVSGWRLSQGHSLQTHSTTESEMTSSPHSLSLASLSHTSSKAPSSGLLRSSIEDTRAAAVAKHVQRQRAGKGKRPLVWRGRDAHWQGMRLWLGHDCN